MQKWRGKQGQLHQEMDQNLCAAGRAQDHGLRGPGRTWST